VVTFFQFRTKRRTVSCAAYPLAWAKRASRRSGLFQGSGITLSGARFHFKIRLGPTKTPYDYDHHNIDRYVGSAKCYTARIINRHRPVARSDLCPATVLSSWCGITLN
jgi:hypothetical protein